MGKQAGTSEHIEEIVESNEHDYTAVASGPVDGWVSEMKEPVGSLQSLWSTTGNCQKAGGEASVKARVSVVRANGAKMRKGEGGREDRK